MFRPVKNKLKVPSRKDARKDVHLTMVKIDKEILELKLFDSDSPSNQSIDSDDEDFDIHNYK